MGRSSWWRGKFTVKMLKDELTKGLNDFEIKTEQYYIHYDPNIKVIATPNLMISIIHGSMVL